MSLFTGALAIGSALAAAGATTYAASKSSGAATDAARLQTDATTNAAKIKAQSDAETLAFSKQQAETDWRNQEQARKANYGIQAAQLARRGTLASMLGLQAPTMPDYVASQDPNYTGGGTSQNGMVPEGSQGSSSAWFDSNGKPIATPAGQTGGAPTSGAPSGNLTDPKAWMSLVGDKNALSQWVTQGLGGAAQKPGLVDYYVGKIQGQPGANPTEQAGSATYWMQKLQSDPNVTGQATAPPAAAPAPASAGTLSTMMAPYQVANRTPALQPSLYQGTLSRLGV